MIEIPLGNGLFAVVDDRDAHLAIKKWHATGPRSGVYYAVRQEGARGSVRTIYLHRAVLGLQPGDGVKTDHRDGDGLNCRRYNLPATTQKINAQNKKRPVNNSSGIVGVAYHSRHQHWRAHIMEDQKMIHLGTFKTKEDAAVARATAEIERIGIHPQRAAELRSIIGPERVP